MHIVNMGLSFLLSAKFAVIMIFVLSAMYIHYRGQDRHKFTRQLSDHSTILAPINAIMYLFSAIPKTPYVDTQYFPATKVFRDNWEVIRDEAMNLLKKEYIKAADGYNDAGFNSFFRRGWKRFYIKWYGDYHPSAKELCPNTIKLIEQTPGINAAMFTLLPPGGRLVRHRDPYAGSMRYHLGLITPNSDDCFIFVDNQKYAWRDGDDVIFDETYLHWAENKTDQTRVIFFCDLDRPLKFKLATWFNIGFKKLFMRGSASPNFETDNTGFINKAFKYIYAVRLFGKNLKKKNRRLYYATKYLWISCLVGLVLYII